MSQRVSMCHTSLLTSTTVHMVAGGGSLLELLDLLGHGHISARLFRLSLVACWQVERFGHCGTFPSLCLKTSIIRCYFFHVTLAQICRCFIAFLLAVVNKDELYSELQWTGNKASCATYWGGRFAKLTDKVHFLLCVAWSRCLNTSICTEVEVFRHSCRQEHLLRWWIWNDSVRWFCFVFLNPTSKVNIFKPQNSKLIRTANRGHSDSSCNNRHFITDRELKNANENKPITHKTDT